MANVIKERERRLRQITRAHESTHLSVHNDFKRKMLAELHARGLTPPRTLAEYMALPPEFHEAMHQHKRDTVMAIDLAMQAKSSSVARLPRPQRGRGEMRLVRMN